jgi:hypothetical protein
MGMDHVNKGRAGEETRWHWSGLQGATAIKGRQNLIPLVSWWLVVETGGKAGGAKQGVKHVSV